MRGESMHVQRYILLGIICSFMLLVMGCSSDSNSEFGDELNQVSDEEMPPPEEVQEDNVLTGYALFTGSYVKAMNRQLTRRMRTQIKAENARQGIDNKEDTQGMTRRMQTQVKQQAARATQQKQEAALDEKLGDLRARNPGYRG
jgi:hypothetical protein